MQCFQIMPSCHQEFDTVLYDIAQDMYLRELKLSLGLLR